MHDMYFNPKLAGARVQSCRRLQWLGFGVSGGSLLKGPSGEHGGLARERVIKEKHCIIHHDTSMTYFTMLQVSH